MVVVKVIDQKNLNMATLHKQMVEIFEYLVQEISDTSFRDSVGCFMKEELGWRKGMWSEVIKLALLELTRISGTNLWHTGMNMKHIKGLKTWLIQEV